MQSMVLCVVGLALSLSCASAKDATIHPHGPFVPIPVGPQIGDVHYECRTNEADRCSIEEFLERSRVCALVVVKSGTIRFQWFNRDRGRCEDDSNEPDEPDGWSKSYSIASVTKSITSTLLGQAIAQKYKARSRADFEAETRRPIDELIPARARGWVDLAVNGSYWLGDEYGPYLLHVDRAGRLLSPPVALPDVRSPENPAGNPNLGRSKGFEAMPVSPDGRLLYPTLEGTVAGDPPGTLRQYEFDPRAGAFTGRQWAYRLAAPNLAIGDAATVDAHRFLMIERDNAQGAAAAMLGFLR